MKSFIGTCVENPFNRIELLVKITENGKQISKKKFLENCILNSAIKKDIKEYPHDFIFYEYKDTMYFRHSAIEYFYQ